MGNALRTARKAVVSFLIVVAGILGIEFANLDWWVGFILAIVTGLATYWSKKNAPGTLLHPLPEEPKSHRTR